MRVRSLGWEDPLEKETATHSSIHAWKIPWTGEPGGLQSMGLQRVRMTKVSEHQSYSKQFQSWCKDLLRSAVNGEEFLQAVIFGHKTLSLTGSGPWTPYSPVKLPSARMLTWASFWPQSSEDKLKINNTFPAKVHSWFFLLSSLVSLPGRFIYFKK